MQATTPGATPVPKLSFRSVKKGFDGVDGWNPALDDFNLDIYEGEFVCIVGPSGCGKTTALNLAAGFMQPDGGSLTLNGEPILKPGPDRAMVFQEHALFPWLNVEQNIQLGLRLAGKPEKERTVITNFYLKLVHLERFRNSFVHQLSGGMKQRVQLSRALALAPSVLLMDEPFAALDAMTRDFLYVELQQILAATKQTVLFVTHNIREAAILGDRVIVMGDAHPGRIKAVFNVELPRPRAFESPGVIEIASKTLELLRAEFNA